MEAAANAPLIRLDGVLTAIINPRESMRNSQAVVSFAKEDAEGYSALVNSIRRRTADQLAGKQE